MKLKDLIKCDSDLEITNISDDSRKIEKNGLFVAIKGLTVDGNKYIDKAISNGAVAVITEEDVDTTIQVIKVRDVNVSYNEVLNNFYNRPLDKIGLIAVTGTDGKTTVSEIIYQLLNNYVKTGYIGTNGIKTVDWSCEGEYTTPLPDQLFYSLDQFNKRGVKFVSMETSSERLGTNKLDGIYYQSSIFTNLSRDNLNVHSSMEDYALAKAKCFSNTKEDGACILYEDDKYAYIFKEKAKGKVYTFGYHDSASIYPSNIVVQKDHLEFDIHGILGDKHIETSISGEFNVLNLMAVMLLFNHFGYDIDELIENIKKLKPIDARQTFVKCNQPFNVIVDYGHTANAVANLVKYVRTFSKGRIIAVVGAGGSRDVARRTDMAMYCTKNLDYNIFTIEDARYEDPEYLLKTMVEGVKDCKNYELEIDRDKAIIKALEIAKPNDNVLILGKGLEDYMITNGQLVKRKNDYDLAYQYLNDKYNKVGSNV